MSAIRRISRSMAAYQALKQRGVNNRTRSLCVTRAHPPHASARAAVARISRRNAHSPRNVCAHCVLLRQQRLRFRSLRVFAIVSALLSGRRLTSRRTGVGPYLVGRGGRRWLNRRGVFTLPRTFRLYLLLRHSPFCALRATAACARFYRARNIFCASFEGSHRVTLGRTIRQMGHRARGDRANLGNAHRASRKTRASAARDKRRVFSRWRRRRRGAAPHHISAAASRAFCRHPTTLRWAFRVVIWCTLFLARNGRSAVTRLRRAYGNAYRDGGWRERHS